MEIVQQEILRLAQSITGTVGVCAQHIETGQQVSCNAGIRFPMASAYKVPIAIKVLSLVDRGLLSLDQMIEVQQRDLSPGSGIIQSLLYQPGLVLSVQNLLELALVISDNTATDVLLRLVGGPQTVTNFLNAQGIRGLRVDRFVKNIVADRYGLTGLADGGRWDPEAFQQMIDRLSLEDKQAAIERFANDDRDTMTAPAMVQLLVALFSEDLLTAESRDVLLRIMQRCQTGAGALKGFLMPDIVVAHKTGTLMEIVANDVGIITLPGGAGHVAIAVCIQSKEAIAEASSVCQKVIAHIARAVFDYFLFQGASFHPSGHDAG